jgi:hypothetical protein
MKKGLRMEDQKCKHTDKSTNKDFTRSGWQSTQKELKTKISWEEWRGSLHPHRLPFELVTDKEKEPEEVP